MPAPSGSPALWINFIFTKAVYLKVCAFAVEGKAFPDPSGLFTFFKGNCWGVHDVLTVLPFSSLHYFNRVYVVASQQVQYAEAPEGTASENTLFFKELQTFFTGCRINAAWMSND